MGSGEVKDNVVDFLEKLKAVIDAKIEAAKPLVKAALEKIKAAIEEIKAKAEAGIEQGKGLLAQLLQKIMEKLAELKDQLTGYNIFGDLLNDVLKPAIKHAIENLIPTIAKHLGDLADKLKPAEYSMVETAMEAVARIKAALAKAKEALEKAKLKDKVVNFWEELKKAIEAQIEAAKPIVKAILEKVKIAVDEIKAKAEAGLIKGKNLLVILIQKIYEKLDELKDQLVGYNIFDDLLNDALKPAIKHAIENLIHTIGKHREDLADKLKPKEYISFNEIMEVVKDLKDIFAQVKAKIESGEVKDNIVDFLNKIKAAVEAKIAAATPAVKAVLEKVD